MKTTIQDLKAAIIEHNKWVVKSNESKNGTYEQIADQVWAEKIGPFLKNEDIKGWQVDIQKKFADNPYVRYYISEKQAYCLAKAYADINPDTIS